MAPARECCQWLTMMRQWMMRLDDSSTAENARKPAAELEAVARCEDVMELDLV